MGRIPEIGLNRGRAILSKLPKMSYFQGVKNCLSVITFDVIVFRS